MTQAASPTRQHSNSYNIFILVLTIISLVIMVVMFLPLDEATLGLLQFYDNLICIIFLIDFFMNLSSAKRKSDYFIKERGWLDLLGSIPSLALLSNAGKYAGLFRLARLSRLARITRLLQGQNKKQLVEDVINNRGQYVAFVTILLTIIILSTASVLVLQFEGQVENSNIKTGWDAFWYSVVTITTVGYGDRFPITIGGRITAMFIMFMGVGIIGVLASILSSLLVGSPSAPPEEEKPETALSSTVEQELSIIKDELAVMRQLLEKMSNESDQK